MVSGVILGLSRITSYKYLKETSGNLNAALIIYDKTCGAAVVNIAHISGLVDQTREDVVSDRGKNAIGPVGKNR